MNGGMKKYRSTIKKKMKLDTIMLLIDSYILMPFVSHIFCFSKKCIKRI